MKNKKNTKFNYSVGKVIKCILTVFILLQFGLSRIKAELFTSIFQMEYLVYSSFNLTQEIDSFLINNYLSNEHTHKTLNSFNQLNKKAIKDSKTFISNPINCFLLIKQLTTDSEDLFQSVERSSRLIGFLNVLKKKYLLPNLDDYFGALFAIFRLQDTYKLTPKDFLNKSLSPKYPTVRKLNFKDFYTIGNGALEVKAFRHAFSWLNSTLELIEHEPYKLKDKLLLMDKLANASLQLENKDYAIKLYQEYLEISPNDANIRDKLDSANRSNFPNMQDKLKKETNLTLTLRKQLYDSLCRGENADPIYSEYVYESKISSTQPSVTSSLLKCKYTTNKKNPFLIIGPIKEEIVYLDPLITIYHDIFSNNNSETIKNMSKLNLTTASVLNIKTGAYLSMTGIRVAKLSWLNDNQHKSLENAVAIINSLTNLNAKFAEPWQVVNYGIGGQYEAHYDFTHEDESSKNYQSIMGNRIATWMIYLEQPEKGGRTVFPDLNLSVEPKLGSALLWYNMHRNLSNDYRTAHAGCPVLFGQKWVANKWIGSKGQIFKRKCSLLQHE